LFTFSFCRDLKEWLCWFAAYGSRLAGERHGIMEASLLLLLQTPNYVTEEKRFDVIVLVSMILSSFRLKQSMGY